MSIVQTLDQIRTQIQALAAETTANPLDRAKVVEIGTALAAITTSATDALTEIKETLRKDALQTLHNQPGSTDFDGIEFGRVTVTIPTPKLEIVKGTDPEVLKRILADTFDIYFETKMSYAPRKNAGDLVARMATGRDKDLLLCSLVETEQTPRVSFRKV
jgi:hypothetical protein